MPRSSRDAGDRETVTRAARLMDKLVPGWAQRIQLEKLNMKDVDLCVLGQLFGTNVETAIAKEMYPELWAEHNQGCGYGTGKHMIPRLLGEDADVLTVVHPKSSEDSTILYTACCGWANECFWAEEVAERLVGEEASEDVKST